MAHLPNLIIDLALILGAAGFITLLFKWLKQPVVLGYIIAGFLVGPYFKWLPTVYELENIRIWAEIGVIFLLFSLGLEFSFKKLLKVGGSATITALVEVVIMVAIGFGAGRALGWSPMDSLFLGGILSISSTTIIFRAFEELGLQTKKFAILVFGVLIVEDLVAIVLMVLLSTVSVSRQFAGGEMMYSISKLIFFLVIWFLLGIFFIPTLLRKVKHLLTGEMLLILSLALCLLMVLFADAVGFSPALGAFIMGSILAETTKAEKIEQLIRPVKNLFGAIFFVSVGMLIDPAVLVTYAFPIFILCLATIFGKLLSTTAGALISGQNLQTAIQAGFSLAQIGEFSFIIATLGLTLNVTSDFLYPVAVALSAVTTLTTPYLIKSSWSFYHWLNRVLPANMIRWLNSNSTDPGKVPALSDWRVFIRAMAINKILLSVIIISIIIISSAYVQPLIANNGNSLAARIAVTVLTLIILSPFLWALAIKGPAENYKEMLATIRYRRRYLLIKTISLALAAMSIGFLIQSFFDLLAGLLFTFFIVILLGIFSKKVQAFYARLESRFMTNLNQREIETLRINRAELAPWDAHIVPLKVEPLADCIGKTLYELQWRETIGINVVMIKRGEVNIPAPGKEQMIFPQDELLVLGTDHQIQRLKVLLRARKEEEYLEEIEVELYDYFITDNSLLAGKTIRDTGLREKAQALVVGVGRKNHRILNPDSDFTLQSNDILFVVGNKKKLQVLLSTYEV